MCDELAEVLKKYNLPHAYNITALEMLKTDIILNEGLVTIDGKALQNSDNDKTI